MTLAGQIFFVGLGVCAFFCRVYQDNMKVPSRIVSI